MKKEQEEKFKIGDYIWFDNTLHRRNNVGLKASDEQLKGLSKENLRRLLATGIRGNDYKKVMFYVLSK